ncbi:unnamed protein product [Chrysodeixis includens]|uniref:Uncharacterized protein n=1 Tax=Chrysodeixis includens TaxID=689277 RepID=A0A9N8PYB7_CHRIL|nr:unnamed protein product [Chrysodeixis includens]
MTRSTWYSTHVPKHARGPAPAAPLTTASTLSASSCNAANSSSNNASLSRCRARLCPNTCSNTANGRTQRAKKFSTNSRACGVDSIGDLDVKAGGLTKHLMDSLRISTKACCGRGCPMGPFIAL